MLHACEYLESLGFEFTALPVSPVAAQNGEMQRDSWYHVTRKRALLDFESTGGNTAALDRDWGRQLTLA